ncbi:MULTISPECIES: hypothetical protein [unclassified Brevundimonas]|uniref:hypothetical protein n=1 Tax=unclassified Brevundimonas TaxID=2622653 RepID=UPI003F8FAD63
MTRFAVLGSVAVLALAGCKGPAEKPAAAEAPAADQLTTEGFGAIRVGQTLAEVEQAYGAPAKPIVDPNGCNVFHPARAPEGVWVMTEEGKVSRVTLRDGASVTTDRALGLGAPAAEVKRVYGAAAQLSPHKYESAPSEYITVWSGGPRGEAYVTEAAARGVRYDVGANGKVKAVHGGGPSIQLVESCG